MLKMDKDFMDAGVPEEMLPHDRSRIQKIGILQCFQKLWKNKMGLGCFLDRKAIIWQYFDFVEFLVNFC